MNISTHQPQQIQQGKTMNNLCNYSRPNLVFIKYPDAFNFIWNHYFDIGKQPSGLYNIKLGIHSE